MLRLCLVLALLVAADAALAQQRSLGASTTDNAAAFRGQNGRRVTYVCPEQINLGAQLWGTDIYTDDSPLCLSAIHAGALTAGRAGIVTVVIGGNQPSFRGETRFNVRSIAYTDYPSSMTFDNAGAPGRTDWATTAQGVPPSFATPIVVTCPPNGRLSAPIWGSGVYTDDSAICVAAVHANLITVAAGGDIAVTMKPGTTTFAAETRNGVGSQSYNGAYSAFTVALPGQAPNAQPTQSTSNGVTGIAVRVTVATATVTWTPVADALGYVVARWKSGDAGCCNTMSPPGALLAGNTWVDTAPLPTAGAYGFRIYAHTASGVVAGEQIVSWNGVQTPTTQLLSPGATVDPVRTATRTTSAAAAAGATAPQPVTAVTEIAPSSMPTATLATPLPTAPPPGGAPDRPQAGDLAGAPNVADGGGGGSPGEQSGGPGQPQTSGRYRVVLLGATARATTKDAVDQLDGIGDEVLPAVATLLWDRRTGGEQARSFTRGLEYGNVDAPRKAADRIKAGSGAGGGGIIRGNSVPDGFMKDAPGAPTTDRFPLLVWDGVLNDGIDALLVVPSLWERDVGRALFDLYTLGWSSGAVAQTITAASGQLALPDIVPFDSEVHPGVPTSVNPIAVALNADDRPIGLRPGPIAFYRDRFVVITHEKLRSLAPGAVKDIAIQFAEPSIDPVLGGDYELQLRVQRIE
jgi:hypothetical protein